MNQIRPEMADHPLAKAAREINSYAEKHGLDDTCKLVGLETKDVAYIAQQRALRCILAFRGEKVANEITKPFPVPMNNEELMLSLKLATAYMDGLAIGWRAASIK